ncbi:MAG: D-alanine--D-alanine ligase family protein [Candidatus Nanopelagicales bacterium]
MSIVVLAGGLSHERDVSIRSGRRVSEALKDAGVDVIVRDVDSQLLREWAIEPPEVALPMLHGAAGEDGSLRDVLDALQVPFVGSTAAACRMAFDKPIAKAVVAAAGLHTPPAVALPHSSFRELGAEPVIAAVVARVQLPIIVKPSKGGSSLGVSVVREQRELATALVAAFAYGEVALIEHFVEGVEVAVSVIERAGEPLALPAVEIVPDGGVYNYTARYTAGTTEFFVPARLSEALTVAAAEAAVRAHQALGLRDLSRSDLIIDADGKVWFLEVNVAPGMTETSLFPQAVAAAGLDFGEVLGELVAAATSRTVIA